MLLNDKKGRVNILYSVAEGKEREHYFIAPSDGKQEIAYLLI